VGIATALLEAHRYTAIYDSSPLVVVGIHRLLVAILQAALNPQKDADLFALWKAGRFPEGPIQDFAAQYDQRFDLFSLNQPFLQSADLPLAPDRSSKTKTVGYLLPEWPSGTGVIHYRHLTEGDHVVCPACATRGLVTIPCFATSGGAGIKPSINGVPPIYVIPSGRTLFESLAASLVLPAHQPSAAALQRDTPWWQHPPIVGHGDEVIEVGYLHSLTFPARRVRLHPRPAPAACMRCGAFSDWTVRTMVFEMGESRPKDAALWMDPFAAYRLPDGKSAKAPTPVRPNEGKVLWREYAALFLTQPSGKEEGRRTLRPRVLDQLSDLEIAPPSGLLALRCVGLRTDMKAKIFEWLDAGFEVPAALLADETAGWTVQHATRFAEDAAGSIVGVFKKAFGGAGKNANRYADLRQRMLNRYWAELSPGFRTFVLDLAQGRAAAAVEAWSTEVIHQAQTAFRQAADATGERAADLRRQALGWQECQRRLGGLRKKYLVQEGVTHE
jgi:CRISPR system Cascade subunit CasA